MPKRILRFNLSEIDAVRFATNPNGARMSAPADGLLAASNRAVGEGVGEGLQLLANAIEKLKGSNVELEFAATTD